MVEVTNILPSQMRDLFVDYVLTGENPKSMFVVHPLKFPLRVVDNGDDLGWTVKKWADPGENKASLQALALSLGDTYTSAEIKELFDTTANVLGLEVGKSDYETKTIVDRLYASRQ